MTLSCIVFLDILAYFPKVRGDVTTHIFRDSLSYVGWDLLCLFNPHTKFEVSAITCNEDIKGNAKCKNSRFEPPFGGLSVNAQGSSMARWKVHCRLRG